MWKNATLIAGPTASGKSALALELARQNNGVIINADSMQVYDILQILTARPNKSEMGAVAHYLYGHIAPGTGYSTGHWLNDVAALLKRLDEEHHAIFVGGTGLYFNALLGGLSPMPDIPQDIRERWRAVRENEGLNVAYSQLEKVDPEAAKTLKPTDGQRILRALEVFEASGKSILHWQTQPGTPVVDPVRAKRIVLDPDRTQLHKRIERRFDQMIASGALEEVRAIRALDLPVSTSAMKAIGVRQLGDYLDQKLSLDDAIERSKAATRQYAKRQMTWFRNQFDDEWDRMAPK